MGQLDRSLVSVAVDAPSDLGRRWFDAADWSVVRGAALGELCAEAGMERLAWFDGAVGMMALSLNDRDTDADHHRRAGGLLRRALEADEHGTYQVEENQTYRWTLHVAPVEEGFVAAYTTFFDDGWELRVAELGRSGVEGLLVDLATLVHRLPPGHRPDHRPAGSGRRASLTAEQLVRFTSCRGRSQRAAEVLASAGWPADLVDDLAAAVDEPILGVDVQTLARLPEGGASVGQHRLWLTPAGWTWRVDLDAETALITSFGPIDALDEVLGPLRWLEGATDA